MIDLFINYRAQSAGKALVTSAEVPDEIVFPSIAAGNKTKYRIFLIDGTGSYETFTGDNTYTLKMTFGVVETGSALATQNTWTSENTTVNGVATSCWTATLDASVTAVINYVSGVRDKKAVMEIQLTSPAGAEIKTILQADVSILNRLIA